MNILQKQKFHTRTIRVQVKMIPTQFHLAHTVLMLTFLEYLANFVSKRYTVHVGSLRGKHSMCNHLLYILMGCKETNCGVQVWKGEMGKMRSVEKTEPI